MKTNSSRRNHAFDLLCGICIIRMIALHVLCNTGFHHKDWFEEVMQWTYWFMCFFFFKAGYFNKTMAGRTGEFVLDKAKRLLVPYLSWGAIGTAVYFIFGAIVNNVWNKEILKFDVSHIWTSASFLGDPPLWFLFSFFSAYVAIHLIEKVPKLHWLALAFPALSWWLSEQGNPLWFDFCSLPMGVFFFFLGHVWHWLLLKLRRQSTLLISLALLLAMVVVNTLWPARFNMHSNSWSGSMLSIWAVCLLALCGTSGVLLSLPQRRVPWLCFIGQHSMVFFVLHHIIIYVYKWTHFAFRHGVNGKIEDAILIFVVTLCICSWLVPYIESNPWLSGRWSKAAKASGLSGVSSKGRG